MMVILYSSNQIIRRESNQEPDLGHDATALSLKAPVMHTNSIRSHLGERPAANPVATPDSWLSLSGNGSSPRCAGYLRQMFWRIGIILLLLCGLPAGLYGQSQ